MKDTIKNYKESKLDTNEDALTQKSLHLDVSYERDYVTTTMVTGENTCFVREIMNVSSFDDFMDGDKY